MATDDLLRKRRDPTAPGLVDPTRPLTVVRGLPVQAPAVPDPSLLAPTRADIPSVSVLTAAPYRPIRAGLQDVVDEFQRAEGGARGVGAAARSVLGQAVNSRMAMGRSMATNIGGALGIMAKPFADFGAGLLGVERQPAAVSPPAAAASAPVPEFRVPAGILPASPQGTALLTQGVTPPPAAPRQPTPEEQVAFFERGPPRALTPDGPPVYSTGSGTSGTAQFGNRAVQTIPSNYGAGRTNVVPSFVPDGYNPASALNFTPPRPGAQSSRPRGASSRAEARSQQLDSMLQQIIRQAQQTPGSYGELFARKGTLAALGALGPLAQAAGSNVIQGVGDELQADTARYGIDTGFLSNLGDQNVRARGDDLQFESNLGNQNVNREGNLLQEIIARDNQRVNREGNFLQAQTAREAAERQAQGAVAAAQLGLTRDANKPVTVDQLKAQFGRMLATGLNSDGTALSPEQRAQVEATLKQLQPGGLQLFPTQ